MTSSPIASAGFESSEDHSQMISVLELTKKPLLAVPQEFVWPYREPVFDLSDNHQKPFITSSSPTIPTIDLKNFNTIETAGLEVEKLDSTCKDWGIFQLVNHGVNISLLENLRNEVEGFFKLPFDEKVKYRKRSGDIEGYGNVSRSVEQKLDWADTMYMLTNPIHKRNPDLFSELPSSLRTTLESYLVEVEKLGMLLLGLLAKSLKVDEKETMKESFEDGRRSVNMSYYPPCPQPELVHGIVPHSDATGITILSQLNGVNGLEVKKDGVWIPVNFLQDALVVNIGDTLEIMSNGTYKSIEHRAKVNPSKERISLTTFFNPKFEAEIGPMASLINPQNPPLFKTTTLEKYVKDFQAGLNKFVGKSFLEQMRIDQPAETNHTST